MSKGVFQTMADPKQGVVKNVTWYRSGEPVQLPPVGTSGSGSPEYGDSDTLSASSFGGGTGATGAGISSAGSIPSATSVIF